MSDAIVGYNNNTGRTVTTDIIVGIAMMVLSVVCGVAYTVILQTIWSDKELYRMTSYRFMFALGVFDVLQCFPHFVTGLFTVFQSTWHPWLAKAMGVLATPAYVAYAVLTVVLSFNRFIQLLSTDLDRMLFSGKAVDAWMGVGVFFWVVFALALASPWASIVYTPEWYSWNYDSSMKYSTIVQDVEMYIEIGGIFVSAFFYIFVVILLSRKRKRFMASTNYHAELKILIQAAVITVYCTVLNVFWHNYAVLLPDNIWSYCGLNFMWIFNSGVYPLIYFIVNRAIRQRVSRRKTVAGAVSMFTRAPRSESNKSKGTTQSNKGTTHVVTAITG